MAKIKVRFHLGRGANYMKWQVKYPNGDILFLSPDEYRLVLINCQVKNNSKTAQKIFDGSNKTVCAWITCENIAYSKEKENSILRGCKEVSYNPRVQPHWMLNGRVTDNEYFNMMFTENRKIYIL